MSPVLHGLMLSRDQTMQYVILAKMVARNMSRSDSVKMQWPRRTLVTYSKLLHDVSKLFTRSIALSRSLSVMPRTLVKLSYSLSRTVLVWMQYNYGAAEYILCIKHSTETSPKHAVCLLLMSCVARRGGNGVSGSTNPVFPIWTSPSVVTVSPWCSHSSLASITSLNASSRISSDSGYCRHNRHLATDVTQTANICYHWM